MVRSNMEAALSFGCSPTPLRGKPVCIAGGNFVSARPLGIINGIDMGCTGVVRKINTAAVRQRLNDGAPGLISPLGYPLSGKPSISAWAVPLKPPPERLSEYRKSGRQSKMFTHHTDTGV